MKDIVPEIKKAIQDINGDPSLSPKDKMLKIKSLKGISYEDMLRYLDKNFSTGPELSAEIKKVISAKRGKKNG
jgi:hypothetical protein